ncbi:PAS domain S-box protein [uncultured Albimonas sp.]|uniref:PAS domain S-box protein n=1 Tax=uncultured Albimonas sp. TaxID=1331701 RepID=UPI0030EB9F89
MRQRPTTVAAVVFLAVLGLCLALIHVERQIRLQSEYDLVSQEVMTLAAQIQSEVNSNVYLANGLVAFVAVTEKPSDEEMHAAMAALYRTGRGIRNIGMAPGNRIEYIYPHANNSAAIGLYYPDMEDQWPAVERAIKLNSTVVAGPVALRQGGDGLISRTPVFLEDGTYWGILSLVLDADQLFERTGLQAAQMHLNIALRWEDEGAPAESTFLGDPGFFTSDAVVRDVALPGTTWRIAARPQGGWGGQDEIMRLLPGLSVALAAGVALMALSRQRHRQALARSEQRLASVTEAIRDAIVVTDEAGEVLELNAAAKSLFGLAKPDRTRPVEALFEAAQVRAGPSAGSIAKGWRSDGAELSLEVRFSDTELRGRPKRIYSIRDIGDRIAIESALRESEERFRRIANQIPGVVYQWQEGPGQRKGFTYVSPRSRDILGLEPEALIADWSLFNIHPDDREAWAASIAQSLGSGEDWQFEGRLLRGDETRWWRAYSSPQHVSDERVLFTGVILDITRIKASETALFAKERELSAILESALDGIASIDGEGVILSANAAAGRIFGYSTEELLGRNVSMLMADLHAGRQGQYLKNAAGLATDRIVGASRVLNGKRRNGEVFPLELSVSEITLERGRAFTGILRDITERVASERELEGARLSLEQKARALEELADERDRARLDAERASEAKSSFLAVMSHELRTPMTGILGIADLLLAQDLSERDHDRVKTLRRSGVMLLSLLDDLLDFSKIEAGKLNLEEIPFRPVDLMTDIRDLLASSAHAKGLEFSVEFQVPASLTLVGDPTRIQQILLNLASNAIKFTMRGRVVLRLNAVEDVGRGRRRALFEVVDTGIGISPDLGSHLFEPFTQAEASTTRRFGGTGLGLAISRRLAEAMDGEIGLDSVVGEGSVFRVSLLVREAQDAEIQAFPEIGAALEGGRGRPLDLLVAEDNEANRMLICEALSLCGHSVTAVENGARAVEAVSSTRFDAVIMDMQMPVMDGVTASRLIRSAPGRPPPIILLTADVLARQTVEGEAIFAEVLMKPIDWSRLFLALNRHVDDGDAPRGRAEGTSRASQEAASDEPPPEAAAGAAEGGETGLAILSLEWLEVLRHSLPPGREQAIYESLIDKLELHLRDFERRLSDRDAAGAEQALHSLTGLSRQFGLQRVAAVCARLAVILSAAEVDKAMGLFAELESEVRAGRAEVAAHAERRREAHA